MKKILFIVSQLLLLATAVYAQTPTYFVGGNTTSGNSFPFGNGGGNGSKVQLLYIPGDFNQPVPTGNITHVYFRAYDATGYNGINNYVNLEIKMGLTSLTTLTSTSTNFITPLTTVFNASTYSINFTQAQWFLPMTLQTPFPYTAGTNLIVEVSVTSASATKYIAYTSSTGVRRMWGTQGGSTTTAGDAGRYDIGFEVSTGPPCPSPSSLTATGITSTSATLGWGSVSGSTGYEYMVDQNATPVWPYVVTNTLATSFVKTGLTPSTQYYLHVRNKCSPTNPSPWADLPFTTLPPCKPPVGFKVTNLTPTGGTINWSPWPSAQTYDVLIDQSNQTPTSTTGATNTALTSTPSGVLLENTWYYVHIRSNCAGGEQSQWSLDSFLTPIPCRPPNIKIDHVNTDEAVAYWAAVPTATHYEYALTSSPTPPAGGTEYKFTSLHTSALDDGKDYYIHVRSHCISLNIADISPWATASFKTFPVSVNNIAGGNTAISVYPNPVTDVLNVEISGNVNGAAEIMLTDMSGRELKRLPVQAAKTQLDMSDVAPGVYFIRYTDQSHSKLIKVTRQ
jgi:hypothetical protein